LFLQAFVVACGVRKTWTKVFEGLDTPGQQIKKLRDILADLGMSGRPSMERAKAIKQERELQKELGKYFSSILILSSPGANFVLLCLSADVQEFEQKVTGRSSRSKTKSKEESPEKDEASPSEDKDKDDDAEDDDDDEDDAPRRPVCGLLVVYSFSNLPILDLPRNKPRARASWPSCKTKATRSDFFFQL
jgi:hypothetical protein